MSHLVPISLASPSVMRMSPVGLDDLPPVDRQQLRLQQIQNRLIDGAGNVRFNELRAVAHEEVARHTAQLGALLLNLNSPALNQAEQAQARAAFRAEVQAFNAAQDREDRLILAEAQYVAAREPEVAYPWAGWFPDGMRH